MTKLYILIFLILFLTFLKMPTVVGAVTENSNKVQALIVVPKDWENKFKKTDEDKIRQNILRALHDAQEFYAQKLPDHKTFDYVQSIEVIHSNRSTKDIFIEKEGKVVKDLTNGGLPRTLEEDVCNLYFLIEDGEFIKPPSNRVYIYVLIGVPNGGCGPPREVFWNHNDALVLGESGNEYRNKLGAFMHELGHALGLTYSEFAAPHPCTIAHKENCRPDPRLGNSVPYPPDSEYCNLMGACWNLGDLPNSTFNNSIVNPEISTLMHSPFINPNGDPAPNPIEPPKPSGKIVSISPSIVTVGKDELHIIGNGFGEISQLEFSGPTIRFIGSYEIKKWTDSEIAIFFKEYAYVLPVKFELSVVKRNGERLSFPEVVIQPQFVPTPPPSASPSPSSTPSPLPTPLPIVSPSPISSQAPTSTPTPTPSSSPSSSTPTPTTTTTPSPVAQQIKKQITKITAMNVETGESQDLSSNFNQSLNFKLAPDSKSQAHILFIIGYSDRSSKSLSFTFNYQPNLVTPQPTSSTNQCSGICINQGDCPVGTSQSSNQVCLNGQKCCISQCSIPNTPPFPGGTYAGQSTDCSVVMWYDSSLGKTRTFKNGIELNPSNATPAPTPVTPVNQCSGICISQGDCPVNAPQQGFCSNGQKCCVQSTPSPTITQPLPVSPVTPVPTPIPVTSASQCSGICISQGDCPVGTNPSSGICSGVQKCCVQ